MKKLWTIVIVFLSMLSVIGLSHCRDEELLLNAVLGHGPPNMSCKGFSGMDISSNDTSLLLGSFRVQIIKYSSNIPDGVLHDECNNLEKNSDKFEITQAQDLLDWFGDRGYLAKNIPADSATKVQILAIENDSCELGNNFLEVKVCGLTAMLSEASFEDGGMVKVDFFCYAEQDGHEREEFVKCITQEPRGKPY